MGGCLAPAGVDQPAILLLPQLSLAATSGAFLCSYHRGTAFLPYKSGQSVSPCPGVIRHFILLGRNFQQWRCSTEQGECLAMVPGTVLASSGGNINEQGSPYWDRLLVPRGGQWVVRFCRLRPYF